MMADMINRGDLLRALSKLENHRDNENDVFVSLRDVLGIVQRLSAEPKYPTWIEWCCEIGLCYHDGKGYRFNVGEFGKPIPADIAVKLGLELNGGVSDG